MQGSTEHVDASLQWSGGFTSQHELIRPIRSYEQMADYERLLSRLEELGSQGLTCSEIAEHLHQEGFRPAQRTGKIHKNTVSLLFQKLRRERPASRRAPSQARLQENEWFVNDLASKLEMSKNTLAKLIKQGWVHVIGHLPGYCGKLICWADADELDRLQRLRQTKHGWWAPPPDELITPKVPSTD